MGPAKKLLVAAIISIAIAFLLVTINKSAQRESMVRAGFMCSHASMKILYAYCENNTITINVTNTGSNSFTSVEAIYDIGGTWNTTTNILHGSLLEGETRTGSAIIFPTGKVNLVSVTASNCQGSYAEWNSSAHDMGTC
jgi:hypothetical protein